MVTDTNSSVKAKGKSSWGPNYLRFGISLENDFEGESSYNILVITTRRWINQPGAGMEDTDQSRQPDRLYTEFYHRLPSGVFSLFPQGPVEQDVF